MIEEQATTEAPKRGPAYIKAASDINWLTPPEENETVIQPILGHVTLDPCAHPEQFVQADRKFFGLDPEDATGPNGDGFAKSWTGETIFINPTYGDRWSEKNQGPRPPCWHPLSKWAMKMHVESHDAENPASVLTLLPASTDRRWFHQYITKGAALCLLEERVKFFLPGVGRKAAPGQGHMYALFTNDEAMIDRFVQVLDKRGLVVAF